MKTLIIIPFIFLTGCINLTFDALEFDRYLSIGEIATVATSMCGTTEFPIILSKLKSDVDHQVSYSSHRGGCRPQVAKAANELKDIVDGLYDKYQTNTIPSVEYCKQKTTNISTGSEIIVKELGRL